MQELWEEMSNATKLIRKGEKASTSRWFSFFIAANFANQGFWTMKAIVIAVMLLSQDQLTDKSLDEILGNFAKFHVDVPSIDMAEKDVKDGKFADSGVEDGRKEVTKFKALARNATTLALGIGFDEETHRREAIIRCAHLVARHQHGNQSVQLR